MSNPLRDLQRLTKGGADVVITAVIVETRPGGGWWAETPSGARRAVFGDARIGESVLVKGDQIVGVLKAEQEKTIYVT